MKSAILTILLLFVVSSLIGCGLPQDQRTSRAQSSAIDTVSGIAGGSMRATRNVVNNSSATDTLSSPSSSAPSTSAFRQLLRSNNSSTQPLNRLFQSQSGAFFRGKTMANSQSNDDELTEDELKAILKVLLANPVRDGDTVTYTPDAEEICKDDAECHDLFSHITIVQLIHSDDSGTLSLKYDNSAPLVIGYAPGFIYFEIDILDFKNTLIAIDETAQLPTTAEGKIRLAIDRVGVEAFAVTLSIPQDIKLVGEENGEAFDFFMAATNKVVELRADEINQTASIDFNINHSTLQASYLDALGNSYPSVLNIPEFTGLIEIDNVKQTVTVVGLGVGDRQNDPVSLTIDGQVASSIYFDTLDLTVNGVDQTIALESDLYFHHEATNIHGALDQEAYLPADDFTGTLTMSAPIDTILKPSLTNFNQEALEISNGGPLNVTGTDGFNGSLTVNNGECFIGTDPSNPFPFDSALCP